MSLCRKMRAPWPDLNPPLSLFEAVPFRMLAGPARFPAAATGPSVPRLTLYAVIEGKLRLQIAELGRRVITSGQWCLLSDRGPASAPFPEPGSHGFATGIPLPPATAGLQLPPQLACLGCPQRDAALFVQGACCGRLAALARELISVEVTSTAAAWMRQSQLAEFIARVLERPELQLKPDCRACLGSQDVQALERVARHLEQHLDAEHSIAVLARRFHLNECKLKQGFRAHFDATVFGYLRRKRMEHAWSLLCDRSCSVIDAANAVGYSNASHFARAFREVHAQNPREVRQSGRARHHSALNRR